MKAESSEHKKEGRKRKELRVHKREPFGCKEQELLIDGHAEETTSEVAAMQWVGGGRKM